MPYTINKALQLVYIARQFDTGRPVRIGDLCRSLGLSQRTIQRNLLLLQSEPLYLPLMELGHGEYRLVSWKEKEIMWSPADFLAYGLKLPPVGFDAEDLPPGSACSLSGQPIRRGYRVSDIVTEATTEFLDQFGGRIDGHVSENAARCFKSSDPRQGNPCARPFLLFEDVAYMPTIARDSPATLPRLLQDNGAAVERPCWSDLIRQVWPDREGQPCLAMLTTDTKKRLWIKARVGALGSRTAVYAYDADTALDRVLFVDWERLITCLDLVEEVYTIGFPKAVIREHLFVASKTAQGLGLKDAWAWEKKLQPWRGTDEFVMATLVAQKKGE